MSRYWLAVNPDGKELLFAGRQAPVRENERWSKRGKPGITLPKGSIIAATGMSIKWEDNPIKF